MSERKSSLVIQDILKCIAHIQLYTDNIEFNKFSSDYMITEACLYNIQVIGEAASKLPDDVKNNESQIPWNLIKGMRNRLIHEYFGTDLQLVWNVIKNELPAFKSELIIIHDKLTAQNL